MSEPTRTGSSTRDGSATGMDPKSSQLGELYRSFQVVKTSALGLGAPQGFAVMIHPIGGTSQSPSPAYHTSKMWWTKQRPWLPPSFDLFYGGGVASHKSDHEQNVKIAEVKYRGWEGMVGMKCDIEVNDKDHTLDYPNQLQYDTDMSRLQLKRKGIGRNYEMRTASMDQGTNEILYWKGTKSALGGVKDNAPNCNGNLKLIRPGRGNGVLAVWKNRTDPLILGTLHVFDKVNDGTADQFDEVVVSCLAVVFAERLSGRGWLGGLGKGKTAQELDPA